MDEAMRQRGRQAGASLDALLEAGPSASHDMVRAAVDGIVGFRNLTIVKHREGLTDRRCLDAANALLSLAYGAEFPMSGFKAKRLAQTRDAMRALLSDGAG
jgi:hypothetical protein